MQKEKKFELVKAFRRAPFQGKLILDQIKVTETAGVEGFNF
jgi:hypothetical protein